MNNLASLIDNSRKLEAFLNKEMESLSLDDSNQGISKVASTATPVIQTTQSQPSKNLYLNPYNENQCVMGVALDETFLQPSNGYCGRLSAHDAHRYLARSMAKAFLIRDVTADSKIVAVNFMSLAGEVGEFKLIQDSGGGWRASDGYWYQTIKDFITYNARSLQNPIIPNVDYRTPGFMIEEEPIEEKLESERELNKRFIQQKFVVGQHVSASRISLLTKDFGVIFDDPLFDLFGGRGFAYKGELTPQEIFQYLKNSDGNCIWHKMGNDLFCSAYDKINSQIIQVHVIKNIEFGQLKPSGIFLNCEKLPSRVIYPTYFRLKVSENLSDEEPLIKHVMGRDAAENALKNQKSGTYLIRNSSVSTATAISLKTSSGIAHFLYDDVKQIFTYDNVKYHSLEDSIRTYPILFAKQYKES